MGAEFQFTCDPAEVADARRWLAACLRVELRGQPVGEVIADALIVASELVTNAINAHCLTGRLGWRAGASWLRLSVFDDGPGWPVLRNPNAAESGGRGLHVVRALSSDCGTTRVDGGKEAWAVLAVPASERGASKIT